MRRLAASLVTYLRGPQSRQASGSSVRCILVFTSVPYKGLYRITNIDIGIPIRDTRYPICKRWVCFEKNSAVPTFAPPSRGWSGRTSPRPLQAVGISERASGKVWRRVARARSAARSGEWSSAAPQCLRSRAIGELIRSVFHVSEAMCCCHVAHMSKTTALFRALHSASCTEIGLVVSLGV